MFSTFRSLDMVVTTTTTTIRLRRHWKFSTVTVFRDFTIQQSTYYGLILVVVTIERKNGLIWSTDGWITVLLWFTRDCRGYVWILIYIYRFWHYMAHKIIGKDYYAHDDCFFALDLTKFGHELVAVRPFVWCLFVPLPTTTTVLLLLVVMTAT